MTTEFQKGYIKGLEDAKQAIKNCKIVNGDPKILDICNSVLDLAKEVMIETVDKVIKPL